MEREIAYLPATEQRALFLSGELAPSEVLDAQLERIDTLNGGDRGINAFAEQMRDDAWQEARKADERYALGRRQDTELPPLLGLTVATKEKHALAGRRLSQGLLSQRHVVAEADHPVVERLRAAGALIHARTTSPEFSCATVTHSPMWGVTRNPWNRDKSPGGSSGGAGAALAAGFTTLATASDIAGSTRIPAAFTGSVGYKAPYGRIPGAGYLAADWYRGDGPMGRTVADVALLSSVMGGTHPGDANSWGPWGLSPLPAVLGALSGIRFGISATLGDFPVSPTVAEALERVAGLLRSAGAQVSEVVLPWTAEQVRETFLAHFGQILAPAMADIIGDSTDERAPYTDRFIAQALKAGAKYPLIESLRRDELLNRQLSEATAGIDVLLCPTNAVDWLEADGQYLDGLQVGDRKLAHYWEGHLTSPFNVANRRPVLSIPMGVGDAGIPIGLQVVGQPLQEGAVFAAAQHLEALIGFAARPSETRDRAAVG